MGLDLGARIVEKISDNFRDGSVGVQGLGPWCRSCGRPVCLREVTWQVASPIGIFARRSLGVCYGPEGPFNKQEPIRKKRTHS